MLASTRYLALRDLSSVHGVGSTTARRLYDLGLRSIEDMRNYYGVDPLESQSSDELQDLPEGTENAEANDIDIKTALRVYEDINTP